MDLDTEIRIDNIKGVLMEYTAGLVIQAKSHEEAFEMIIDLVNQMDCLTN